MTAGLYGPSLAGAYVYEDTRDPNHFAPWPGWAATLHDLTAHPPRSLDRLSIALTHRLSGTATVARAVNLGWHLLNGLLFWVLARTVVGPAAALLAVGLFWLHPLQTETVAYVASRPDLIAAMWTLLALLAVSRGWTWAAWGLSALAITGKEAGIVALLLVPLWAWWAGQRWSLFARVSWATTLVLPVLILGPWVHVPVPDPATIPPALTQVSRGLALVAWPVGLTIDHDWAWMTPSIGVGVVVDWVAALGLAWWRNWPLWGLALAWVLVALSPRLLVPLFEGLHERHLYTPLLVVWVAFGAAVFPKGAL